MLKFTTREWWDDPAGIEETEDDSPVIKEYDISSSPNDFNILTIMSFLESGNVKIPGFQRNYVWDIKRASKLIESLIIGLPIPQIFLFEEAKNRFLVIDGQQRLMSIYYFIKRRFPHKDQRNELRRLFDEMGGLPDAVLYDDKYFSDFNLKLSEAGPATGDRTPNPLHGLNHTQLGELRSSFDLRTIRNVIIKQNAPAGDDSSIYEIFNRLNSGGMNLGPQEIRSSLYHSEFYTMLARVNTDPRWRKLISLDAPDVHMKDIESILRGFALLMYEYRASMTRFLNESSRKLKQLSKEDVEYFEDLFLSFLKACEPLPAKPFHGNTGAFTISIYDAVFAAACTKAAKAKKVLMRPLDPDKLAALKKDVKFVEASQSRTAGTGNVRTRLERARAILR
jgi:uncharacterized protein with ParB-like and HNH nuclease domain